MINGKDEWPTFYPKHITLPPAESNPATGNFYRLVKTCPATRACFETTYEETPKRVLKQNTILAQQIFYGISFFADIKDIQKKMRTFPKLKNKKIAYGCLKPEYGNMLRTCGLSHHTIWLKSRCDLSSVFQCIEEN